MSDVCGFFLISRVHSVHTLNHIQHRGGHWGAAHPSAQEWRCESGADGHLLHSAR